MLTVLFLDHLPNSNLGPLFWESIYEQFSNFRDGDPFWYENNQFGSEDLATIYGTTLQDIIERNTNISNLPANVFFIQERQLNATSKLYLRDLRLYLDPSVLYGTNPLYTDYVDLSTTYRLSWFTEGDEIQFMIQAAVTGW